MPSTMTWTKTNKKLSIRKCIDSCWNDKPGYNKNNEEEEQLHEESRESFLNIKKANVFYKKLLKMGGTPVLCGDCSCFSMIMPAKNSRKSYLVSVLHMN